MGVSLYTSNPLLYDKAKPSVRRGRKARVFYQKARPVCVKILRVHFILVFLLGMMLLPGCTTQSAIHVQQPFELKKYQAVRIETCIDRTGFKGKRDLASEATRSFTEKLRDSGLFEISSDAQLVLTCDIESFVEGSAVKRWMLPGWGGTYAKVSVMAWEQPGDKVLGTFRSRASVEEGGLYTIGAEEYILGVAFDDIIVQLKKWIEGEQ
jgi:hypothetical protein